MREIFIYDVIGFDWWTGGGITAKFISKELNQAKADKKDVLIRINSPGGSVVEGIAIYNLIKEHAANGLNITTQVDGIAMSMAAVIMTAGQSIKANKNSVILIHNAWGFAQGNAQDLEQSVELLKAFDEGMIQNYADKTGLTPDEVRNKWFDYKDHSLTAQQALDEKLIDEIIDQKTKAKTPSGEAAINAQAAIKWFAENKVDGAPDNKLMQFIKSQINALMGEFKASNKQEIMNKFPQFTAFAEATAENRTSQMIDAVNAEFKQNGINAILVDPANVISADELNAEKNKVSALEGEKTTLNNAVEANKQTINDLNAKIQELEGQLANAGVPVKKENDAVASTTDEFETSVDREKREMKAKFDSIK